jgi:hypothetical protein
LLLQQVEAIQKVIEPQQDAILGLAKLAAKLDGSNLAEANLSLEGFRKSDKELPNRLFVLQVWRKYDYQTSQKLAQKKAGEFEDPDLAKILDDREKAKEKEKREAQRARSANTSTFKRARLAGPTYARGTGAQSNSPLAATYGQYKHGGGGYNSRGGARGGAGNSSRIPKGDKKCFLCGEDGHFFKDWPSKK